MFKSVVIYRFCKPLAIGPADINARLAERRYQPPAPCESSRAGFEPPVPVVGDVEAPLLHQIDGRWLLCLKTATRKVKAAELQQRLQERVEQIEQAEHRRVLRKERESIKDEVLRDLLPHTFPETRRAFAYITPRTGLLVVEASGHNAAELLLVALREALEGMPVSLVNVREIPGVAMLAWLNGPQAGDDCLIPEGLTLGQFVELRHGLDGGGRVVLDNEDPTDENAAGYRAGNYTVAALALTTDADMAGIKFRLTDDLLIKSIKSDYEVELGEGIEAESAEAHRAALMDAELVLFAGVLDRVWVSLVAAFGGYAEGSEPACWHHQWADVLGIPEGATSMTIEANGEELIRIPAVEDQAAPPTNADFLGSGEEGDTHAAV